MKRPRAPSFVLVLLAISITSVLTGCGGEDGALVSAAVSTGLADPPLLPAEAVDLVCDLSQHTPCTTARVRDLLEVILPPLADRPRSVVRLWVVGADVGRVQLLAEIRVPAAPRRKKRKKVATSEWARETEQLFLKLLEPYTAQEPVRRSPLFEAITKIALAEIPGVASRKTYMISDGLAYCGYANFESAEIPTAAELAPVLHRDRVLTPGVLRDTRVAFVFCDVSRLPSGRGRSSVARMVAITDCWDRLLREAGASDVSFSAGLPVIDTSSSAGGGK